MFVISKHYQGCEFAKLETIDPLTAVEAMRDWLVQACEDPRFSFHVSVQPRVTLPEAPERVPSLKEPFLCIAESSS